MKKELRKSLLEIKRKKDSILIEEKIVNSRLLLVIENDLRKFDTLPKSEKLGVFVKALNELREMKNDGLINEQFDFFGILRKLFGGGVETFSEPIVDKILSSLGFTSQGFLKKFIVSYLTTNPAELMRAFVDCKTFTKLLAKSLIEAVVMLLQEKSGLTGLALDLVRNTVGNYMQDTKLMTDIENKLADSVCNLFTKFDVNAKSLSDKVSGVQNEIPFLGSMFGGSK